MVEYKKVRQQNNLISNILEAVLTFIWRLMCDTVTIYTVSYACGTVYFVFDFDHKYLKLIWHLRFSKEYDIWKKN